MKFKRFIAGCLARIRSLYRSSSEQNPTLKHPSFPETLMNCLDEHVIAAVGDSYRRTHPEETASDWSVTIASGDNQENKADFWSVKKRRRLLQNKIHAEFVSGELLQVQGWVLSQTEAKQCALFSVRASN